MKTGSWTTTFSPSPVAFLFTPAQTLTRSLLVHNTQNQSQTKMIRGEEKIKMSLLKSGKHVREAARVMQAQLLAAFAGGSNDDEDVKLPPQAPVARVENHVIFCDHRRLVRTASGGCNA